MNRVLLIDADILVYQVATSVEVPIDWGDDLWTLHSDFKDAREKIDSMIQDIKESLTNEAVPHLVFALTTTALNFRKNVYAKYKSNRKSVRKPLVWKPLRDYLKQHYIVFEKENLEGDDCLGILATKTGPVVKGTGVGDERIIVSIDKDFKTIPCAYYHMKDREIRHTSLEEADRYFMTQTLTGDTTDGYPGCPGVGPKSAEKILEGCTTIQEMWPKVVAAYKAKGLGEGVAKQMAQCARILRASDYDFKNKKPILWEPPR